MNRRRLLVSSLCLVALAQSGAIAQSPARPKRVIFLVVLGAAQPPSDKAVAEAQKNRYAAWAEHGLLQGRDIVETMVFAQGDAAERARRRRDIVASRPDIILTSGATDTKEFMRLTRDIPIVFSGVSDPILHGLVSSLRRPGGNVTGVTPQTLATMLKRLEVMKEVLPRARRVAWLTGVDPDEKDETWPAMRDEMSSNAARVGLGLAIIYGAGAMNLDARVQALRKADAEGFIPFTLGIENHEVLPIQVKSRMPGFFGSVWQVKAGGFMSLGQSLDSTDWKQHIAIAAKVLRGENPGTIPVHASSKIEMAVNLNTARELGIEVPGSILVRADEVIR